MKLLNKLYFRIMISIVIGLLLAGGWTDIQYPCPPLDNAGCVVWESAIMHPSDLISNKQGSLVEASKTFLITSLVSFGLVSVLFRQKKSIN
jgi:hypothetical protein